MMDETPGIVLAVYAHPDDADVACGGALARWAKAGSAVHLIVCTDGGKGTTDPAVEPAQLAVERAAELQSSSALIGLSSVENLGFPDGELTDADDFRRTHPFATLDLGLLRSTLASVGAHHQRSAAQVALAWVLSQSAIAGAIVGIRGEGEADQLPGAADLRLSETELEEIESAIP